MKIPAAKTIVIYFSKRWQAEMTKRNLKKKKKVGKVEPSKYDSIAGKLRHQKQKQHTWQAQIQRW